jgi:hypothetical protein
MQKLDLAGGDFYLIQLDAKFPHQPIEFHSRIILQKFYSEV